MAEIKPTFTEDLLEILDNIEKEENNHAALELIWMADPTSSAIHNGLRISKVDVSKENYCFDVTIDGKVHPMKIGKFLRYFLANVINDDEILEFSQLYNKYKEGEKILIGTEVKVPPFRYTPRDVKSTFLSLVTKTYPHGHEDEVLQFLPSLQKDKFGNSYKIIGTNPVTMFTSHLDTADRQQKQTKLYSVVEDDEEYIYTDENSILGADDKAGVSVMLYMISHNIPGLYYFFIGEERGGIGSYKVADVFEDIPYMKNIKRCVSFDRRNYHSVITKQLGKTCCSDEFANALCKQYNSNGLSLSIDPTGVYTDSASFINYIAECTNVSVGYFNEHTGKEYQNITYLKNLCSASIKIDWNSLPTKRVIEVEKPISYEDDFDEIHYSDDYKKPKSTVKIDNFLLQKILKDLKKVYQLECRLGASNGKDFIKVELYETDINSISDGLNMIENILKNYKLENAITFDYSSFSVGEGTLKIELI